MRHVPEDEAREVRELLASNKIEFFETFAGNWGVSMPALWLKKNEQYKDTYSLTLKALANQVYENKINNTQAWLLYDDIIVGFGNAKDKQKFLINTLSKYN